MTDDQAMIEAMGRWPTGFAQRNSDLATPLPRDGNPCIVGNVVHGRLDIMGLGDTWEEAFEAANSLR